MEKIKALFKTSGTKQGTYSVAVTAVVIAVVIVANLVAGQIPEGYRNIDVSSTNIYEISDVSRDLLKSLDKEVKMTVLSVKEDADDRIRTFLSKYAALSDKITVEWIDPVLHPSALTDYGVDEDTIVVECEDTGKTTNISFSDILVVDMYSYYYTGNASESEFDGEGQLTSAVNYVTNETDRTIYQTTGHGESSLSGTISELMEKNSYTTEELNLLMNTEIPEDCDLLFMYAPATDLTEDEKEAVETYLSDGGKVMIVLGNTTSEELPNLSSIMETYGIVQSDGYIADPQRCYQGNYYYIFPELSMSGDMSNNISSGMVLLVNAMGLNVTDPARETISTTSFMDTSDGAYSVTENGEEQGSYSIGAVATEEVSAGEADTADETADTDDSSDTESADDSDSTSDSGETKESRLTVISAASMIDSQITDTFTQLDNATLFMNAVSANFDGVQNLSIEAKNLSVEYNTVQYAGLFSLLVIFGIPLAVLIGGFIVWMRRRKA